MLFQVLDFEKLSKSRNLNPINHNLVNLNEEIDFFIKVINGMSLISTNNRKRKPKRHINCGFSYR